MNPDYLKLLEGLHDKIEELCPTAELSELRQFSASAEASTPTPAATDGAASQPKEDSGQAR